MKNYFSISEAAKAVGMTSETLRHYDRIGLVKPSLKDEWTNYRYYTREDIVRLNTVGALRRMDLPLKKIKKCSNMTIWKR
ncbi:MAG: MerR family transcriptional regulator [Clostridia bacterium]|nr:MerR family transcriptional regulator [Clostridia bacterium]